MSFQAYLDNIEARPAKTPAQLVAMADVRGFSGSHEIDAREGPFQ
jgi:hypothetical protein